LAGKLLKIIIIIIIIIISGGGGGLGVLHFSSVKDFHGEIKLGNL